ncbi:MAG: DUF2461 domain-containing protein [Actinomycetes bacterium]
MTAFTGIPVAALDFYDDLESDNSKAWWDAHKTTYDESVRAPMIALADELAAEFGEAKIYRPHRDVRFSKDKTPYKTHQGAFVTAAEGVGFYVQVDAAGLMTAAGWRPRDQPVPQYREAVAGPAGAELERLVAAATAAGFVIDGDRLATRPRGVAPGHPREELLRHKTLFARRSWGDPDWLSTPETVTRVRADWRVLRPLVQWFADHVAR